VRKISNNKIPFGLKNGTLVEVSEVESGLACGCICPSCKRNLQANKGQVVSHYFSHDPSVETKACESAFETSIHLMAKQILCEDGYLIFPGLTISLSKSDEIGDTHVEEMLLEEEVRRSFERVELEKRLEEIRPDIISYIDGKPFLIEVAVTSFADSNKKKIIRNLGLPAIEIDLSSVDHTITKNDLRKLINGSSANKRWLSNPKARNAKKELRARLDEKIRLINEGINRSRRRLQKQLNRPIRQAPNTDDGRFFVCEACRHLFEVPLRNAPYSIETTPCPECGHAVS
jgi:rubrerythrin